MASGVQGLPRWYPTANHVVNLFFAHGLNDAPAASFCKIWQSTHASARFRRCNLLLGVTFLRSCHLPIYPRCLPLRTPQSPRLSSSSNSTRRSGCKCLCSSRSPAQEVGQREGGQYMRRWHLPASPGNRTTNAIKPSEVTSSLTKAPYPGQDTEQLRDCWKGRLKIWPTQPSPFGDFSGLFCPFPEAPCHPHIIVTFGTPLVFETLRYILLVTCRRKTLGVVFLFCALKLGLSEATACELALEPSAPSYPGGHVVRLGATLACWAEAEEGELLLRLPEAHVPTVRLTVSQTAPQGMLVVTIPHLPGVRAWFELRVGSGGREWTAARSREFLISPHPFRPVATLVQRQGEWWPAPGPCWEDGLREGVQAIHEAGSTQPWLVAMGPQENFAAHGGKPPCQAPTRKTTSPQCHQSEMGFRRKQISLPLLE